MACGNHHSVRKIMLHHVEHDKRCRRGFVDQVCLDLCRCKYLCRPLHGFFGEKSAVISHNDALFGHTLALHFVDQPLRQKLYICLCKIVSNHGSPAAGSKFDHINVPFLFLCYPITTLTSCLLPCAITGIRSTFSPSRYNSCTPFITPSGFST